MRRNFGLRATANTCINRNPFILQKLIPANACAHKSNSESPKTRFAIISRRTIPVSTSKQSFPSISQTAFLTQASDSKASWQSLSASKTCTPKFLKVCAAALFPQPIAPVIATLRHFFFSICIKINKLRPENRTCAP